LDIGGELRYSHDEHIDIHGGLHLFSFETDLQAEAWNLPTYTINLGGTYDFQDKLLLKIEARFVGMRKATLPVSQGWNDLSAVPTAVDAKGYVDLYLGLEYRYTKRFSVFLDASNLSASKYERWYNYSAQRALVLGGATYAF
jgi:outer membrane receptor protein involved in Fe transport